jgi:hypothetical protein
MNISPQMCCAHILLTWNIFLLIGGGFLIFLMLMILLIFLIGNGLSEKFGPEWIPHELGIRFNHLKISVYNPKITSYQFSEFETESIRSQISCLISGESQTNPVSYPDLAPSAWIRTDGATYEFRQTEDNLTKAIFSTKNRELVYFK